MKHQIQCIQRNFLYSIINDSKTDEYKMKYINAIRYGDVGDNQDLFDYYRDAVLLKNQRLMHLLRGEWMIDDIFSKKSIIASYDLLDTAERLMNEACYLELYFDNRLDYQPMIKLLRDTAFKFVLATSIPKYSKKEELARDKLGIDGHIDLARQIVDLRSKYRNKDSKTKRLKKDSIELYKTYELHIIE